MERRKLQNASNCPRENTEEQADDGENNDDNEVGTVAHQHVKGLVGVGVGELLQVFGDGIIVGNGVTSFAESLNFSVNNGKVSRVVDLATSVDGGADTNGDDGEENNEGVNSQHDDLEGLEAEEPADRADDITNNASQRPEETQAEGPVAAAGSAKREGNTQTETDGGNDNHDLSGAVGTLDHLSLVEEGGRNHRKQTNEEEEVTVVNQKLVQTGVDGADNGLRENLEGVADKGVTALQVDCADRSSSTAVSSLEDSNNQHRDLEACGDEVSQDKKTKGSNSQDHVGSTSTLEQVKANSLDVRNIAGSNDGTNVKLVRRAQKHTVSNGHLKRNGVHVKAKLGAVNAGSFAEGTHLSYMLSDQHTQSKQNTR
ncbi:Piso0 005679, putative [Babesia ovata]|uniref:Piso0 005679, putative n=1 Tax=Babesia ovata TaxID=189622 RepID=A0A2H6K6D0_9APIC|nr:Piso0 005679, putative [Babesia ovata]GBE58539.1 Piso0 005679, putative [Babesia ovata]